MCVLGAICDLFDAGIHNEDFHFQAPGQLERLSRTVRRDVAFQLTRSATCPTTT